MQNKTKSPVALFAATLLASTALVASTAEADVWNYESNGSYVGVQLDGAVAGFTTDNNNFGQGVDTNSDGIVNDSAQWMELAIEPIIKFGHKTQHYGSVHSALSAVMVTTRGEDASGLSDGSPEDISPEQAWVSWQSEDLFSELGENAIEFKYGAFKTDIGDGFLIKQGSLSTGSEAGYWLQASSAFEEGAMLSFNTHPVSGQIFSLESDTTQGSTKIVGANVEYTSDYTGTLGVTAFRGVDSSTATRDGLDTIYLWAQDVPTGIDNLAFAGGYAKQDNDETGGKVDAKAWHAGVTYSFDHEWSPTLGYRYMHFSGNDTSTTGESEAFDPLFYAFRGYGNWYMGEVTGEYLQFSSNQNIHMLSGTISPREDVTLGAIYYHFTMDQDTTQGNDDFADEFNVYADWAINDNLYLTTMYGIALPGDAASDTYGNNDDAYQVLQAALLFTF